MLQLPRYISEGLKVELLSVNRQRTQEMMADKRPVLKKKKEKKVVRSKEY